MITCDKGKVHIEGSMPVLLAELSSIIYEFEQMLIEDGDMSREEADRVVLVGMFNAIAVREKLHESCEEAEEGAQ